MKRLSLLAVGLAGVVLAVGAVAYQRVSEAEGVAVAEATAAREAEQKMTEALLATREAEQRAIAALKAKEEAEVRERGTQDELRRMAVERQQATWIWEQQVNELIQKKREAEISLDNAVKKMQAAEEQRKKLTFRGGDIILQSIRDADEKRLETAHQIKQQETIKVKEITEKLEAAQARLEMARTVESEYETAMEKGMRALVETRSTKVISSKRRGFAEAIIEFQRAMIVPGYEKDQVATRWLNEAYEQIRQIE